MPVSVSVAAFALGAVLLFAAIFGGGFKLFGAEVSGTVTVRARMFAGVLAAAFLSTGLVSTLRPPEEALDAPRLTSDPIPTLRDAERLASRWVAAMQSRDLDALVAMAGPPFYMDQDIRFSKADIRSRYESMLVTAGPWAVSRMDVRTVEQFRASGLLDQRDRIISSMHIEDGDFAVAVYIGDEAIALFFRRVNSQLEMAGFWD